MIELLPAVFVASLVGSLHCAGMCGGIVVLCVGGEPARLQRPEREWLRHVAYNGGRLVAYATLGAVSGAIGAGIDLGGAQLGWPRVTAVLAGTAMIVFGLVALMRTTGVRTTGMRGTGVRLPAPLQRGLDAGMRAAQRHPPVRRSLVIGLLTALLPCGWLYAFVLAAAATGSAALGALTMAVFWAGTVPILLGLGVGVQSLVKPLRRRLPTVTAVALIVVGAAAVLGRLDVPAYADAAPAASTPLEVIAAEPPCCHDDS